MQAPNFSLSGKTALVTGAGSGLGQGFAAALAAHGANVCITELPEKLEAAETTLELIRQAGREAAVFALDVRNVNQARQVIEDIHKRFAPVDILVNNAGVNRVQWAHEVSEDNWDLVLDTNLKGAFFVAQAVGKQMIERARGGRIINIASQNGLIGYYQRAAYCSAKAGLINQTRVLALEWARYGITVNAIAPTFVLTPLTVQTFSQPDIKRDLESRIPLGRIATVEDITGACVFLASPAASFITGHTLSVDGGWTAI